VNMSPRPQAAAGVNEILLGAGARRLLAAAVSTEQADTGFRLLGLAAAPGPGPVGPLSGRDAELAELEAALVRATATRSVQLVTVVGDAGIGKSRLARELRAALAGRCRALVGRCLPYGEGIALKQDDLTDTAPAGPVRATVHTTTTVDAPALSAYTHGGDRRFHRLR